MILLLRQTPFDALNKCPITARQAGHWCWTLKGTDFPPNNFPSIIISDGFCCILSNLVWVVFKHVANVNFASFLEMLPSEYIQVFDKGKGSKKKNIKKKLTNVSLYVCMSAENSKMLVFVCFIMFFPIVAWEKKHKMLVFMEYVCM